MPENHATVQHSPEFPNLVRLLADWNSGNPFGHFLHSWESVFYSVLAIVLLGWVAYRATSSRSLKPGRLQTAAEFFVTFVDDFVCGVMGPRGRTFVPFIGTLFVYILTMNYMGLVPLLKSPTSELSTTLALALVVFFYMLYIGIRELGVVGFVHHLMGEPRNLFGLLTMGLLMLVMETISILVRPVSLSLRLRSNIFGDDVILATFAERGVQGFLWLVPNFFLVLLASAIQAGVFAMLAMVYFSMFMKHEKHH